MTVAENAAKYLEDKGIEVTAKFVPQSNSRYAGQDPCINWKVTVWVKGREILTTDYMQGIAHAKGYKLYGENEQRELDAVAETGRYVGSPCLAAVKPTDSDVIWCLLSDSEAINYACFEDWAGDFGYNVDSREAEKAYKDCLATGLALRAGGIDLDEAREVFQDY